jgi:hypothetical protein
MLPAQFLSIIIFSNTFSKVFGLQLEKWKKIAGRFGTTGSISFAFNLKNILFLTYSSELLHVSLDILKYIWHIEIHLTYWNILDILKYTWHIEIHLTYWNTLDILKYTWHIEIYLTYWNMLDIFLTEVSVEARNIEIQFY